MGACNFGKSRAPLFENIMVDIFLFNLFPFLQGSSAWSISMGSNELHWALDTWTITNKRKTLMGPHPWELPVPFRPLNWCDRRARRLRRLDPSLKKEKIFPFSSTLTLSGLWGLGVLGSKCSLAQTWIAGHWKDLAEYWSSHWFSSIVYCLGIEVTCAVIKNIGTFLLFSFYSRMPISTYASMSEGCCLVEELGWPISLEYLLGLTSSDP